MPRNAYPLSLKVFLFSLISGLIALVIWILQKKKKGSSPREIILKTFTKYEWSEQMIKYFTAISAFETAGWTSKYFRNENNLFAMTLASKNTLATGKAGYGQEPSIAHFKSIEDSAEDFQLYLKTRFNYPDNFTSLLELVSYMKYKGYFESDESKYYDGVSYWLQKLK
jgi:hypothetical protein